MGDRSKIEWTDASWNPVTGCTKVSAGCDHCYAERYAGREIGDFRAVTRRINDIDVVEHRDFTDVHCHPDRLDQPLRWRKGRKVFVCSVGDLFHEAVPDGFVMRVLSVMAQTPHHRYQLLTKRADRMRSFFVRWVDLSGEDFDPKLVRGPEETRRAHPSPRGQLFASMLDAMGQPPNGYAYPTFDWMDGMITWPTWFSNIWLGVSVESPDYLSRLDDLRHTPAAIRFVSFEPLLADLGQIDLAGLDWVIVGGESGPKARPMAEEWVRSVMRQCQGAGVPVFVKQLHRTTPRGGIRVSKNMSEWPEDLRVREFPKVRNLP